MPSDEMVEKAFAFEVGQPVEKFTGEALWSGVVVSRYHTTKGGERYVVEVKPQGFQMIAVPSQLRTALAAAEAGEPVAFTTGHCKEKQKPGGCQLHNLHCAYPDCDRKPVASPPSEASRDERAAIRKEAFEAAAKVADGYDHDDPLSDYDAGWNGAAQSIATAIRARGET